MTLFLGLASVSLAQTGVPDAIESDPNTMGWMEGFPPSDDRVIGHPASDYFSFPKLRWTFCHFREIQATRRVTRGRGPVSPLPESLDSAIDDLTFTPIGGDQTMTWQESLDANYTDGTTSMSLAQWSIENTVSQTSDTEAVVIDRSSGLMKRVRRV